MAIVSPFISTHAPLRGATRGMIRELKLLTFLLTRLCEARLVAIQFAAQEIISTHAPLRGATIRTLDFFNLWAAFLLTRLCEARRSASDSRQQGPHFYSRASARRDVMAYLLMCSQKYFYSRASARRDQPERDANQYAVQFLLTRLCEARRKTRR